MSKKDFYTEQNDRIAYANDALRNTVGNGLITDAEVHKLALKATVDMQDDAIITMNYQYGHDTEDAQRVPAATQQRIGEIAQIIAKYEAADEEQRRQLAIVGTYFKQACDIKLSDHSVEVQDLTAEQASLLSRREVQPEGNEHLFAAWNLPISERYIAGSNNPYGFPELLDWSKIGAQQEPIVEADHYIDEYPDLRPLTTPELGAHVRERYHSQTDAGRMSVYLLFTDVGRTWTSQEIGQEVYTDEEKYAGHNAHKASSLMSTYVTGKKTTIHAGLRDIEKEQGLDEGGAWIEFGCRWRVDAGGKRFGKGNRICRARIRGRELAVNAPEVADYHDEWSLASTPELNGYQRVTCANIGDVAVQDFVDSQVPVGNVGAPEVIQIGDAKGLIQQDEAAAGRVDKPGFAIRPERDDWRASFKIAVASEIEGLAGKGLDLLDDSIPTGALLSLGSNTLGTKTCYERAEGYGIISSQPKKGSALPLEAVIAMSLQNRHTKIFSNPHRREAIMYIIRQEICGWRTTVGLQQHS